MGRHDFTLKANGSRPGETAAHCYECQKTGPWRSGADALELARADGRAHQQRLRPGAPGPTNTPVDGPAERPSVRPDE